MSKGRWAAALAAGALAMAAAAGARAALTSEAEIAAAADPVPKLMTSPDDVARGKALFTGVCGAYCHKMSPGPGDAPYLFGCTWIFGGEDAQLFHTITTGAPGTRMVSFKGAIPDADIWRIIAYLKSASTCKR